jgi:hypothetical protein
MGPSLSIGDDVSVELGSAAAELRREISWRSRLVELEEELPPEPDLLALLLLVFETLDMGAELVPVFVFELLLSLLVLPVLLLLLLLEDIRCLR